MQRIKCIISYDGSLFSGYQVQVDKRTVQGEIEAVLTKMHKTAVELMQESMPMDKLYILTQRWIYQQQGGCKHLTPCCPMIYQSYLLNMLNRPSMPVMMQKERSIAMSLI